MRLWGLLECFIFLPFFFPDLCDPSWKRDSPEFQVLAGWFEMDIQKNHLGSGHQQVRVDSYGHTGF